MKQIRTAFRCFHIRRCTAIRHPENACGQFQNLAFRSDKSFYIELLAGC